MPRQEELEVALRDSITPGLRAIARELRELNKAARETRQQTSDEMDAMAKSTQNLAQTARNAVRDMQNLTASVVNFGKQIIGVGGAYEAVTKLSDGLKELSGSRVQLQMFAHDMRMSAEEIDTMRNAMSRMGIEAKTADGYIASMSNKLQELHTFRQSSQLFQDLAKMGEKGVSLANRLMDEKDVRKQIKMIQEVIKDQTPEAQKYIADMLGVPPSVITSLTEYEKKVGDVLLIPPEIAQKYQDNLASMNEKADAEWKIFGAHAMQGINEWMDKLNSLGTDKDGKAGHGISEFLISGFDELNKMIKQDAKDVQGLFDLLQKIKEWGDWVVEKWRPDLAEKRKQTGTEEQGKNLKDAFGQLEGADKTKSAMAFREAMGTKLQEENTKLLTEIRDSLRKLEDPKAYGGAGIRSEGADVSGPMQAGGGGFRPSGGVSGARAAKAAADAVRARGGSEEEAAAAARAASPATASSTEVDSRQFGTLAEQRAPYMKWLNDHPEEKRKLAGLLVSEEPSREGRVGTAETFLNRMIAHGVKPEQMASSIEGLRSGSGVYYEPLRPGGTYERSAAQLNANPDLLKQTLEDIDKAGGGSNVSGLGTQNASAGVAANAAQTSTVTREAIKGISDQWSRKDIRPDIHGALRVRQEADWHSKTLAAMRNNIDDAAAAEKKSVFEKGSAAVTVDFGDQKRRTDESAEGGKVFKPLNNERAPQAPKAGGEGAASFNDRWHFQ